jgi:hypothetical protein
MPGIDLNLLVERLGDVHRQASEASAGLPPWRTHQNIEFEHRLLPPRLPDLWVQILSRTGQGCCGAGFTKAERE